MEAIDYLYWSLVVVFGTVIGWMVVRQLLFTAIEHDLLTFDFAAGTPVAKISTIVIIGLAVLAVLGIISAIAYSIPRKKV